MTIADPVLAPRTFWMGEPAPPPDVIVVRRVDGRHVHRVPGQVNGASLWRLRDGVLGNWFDQLVLAKRETRSGKMIEVPILTGWCPWCVSPIHVNGISRHCPNCGDPVDAIGHMGGCPIDPPVVSPGDDGLNACAVEFRRLPILRDTTARLLGLPLYLPASGWVVTPVTAVPGGMGCAVVQGLDVYGRPGRGFGRQYSTDELRRAERVILTDPGRAPLIPGWAVRTTVTGFQAWTWACPDSIVDRLRPHPRPVDDAPLTGVEHGATYR